MIERATPSYLARLLIPEEEGGFWRLHRKGIAPFVPTSTHLGDVLSPEVDAGGWVVVCPRCSSDHFRAAQKATPDWSRFLCVDCANSAIGHQWWAVEWPDPVAVEAIEVALLARPDVFTRNWRPFETVGLLLVENMAHGLLDGDHVAGDIGADQTRVLTAAGPRALSRGGL